MSIHPDTRLGAVHYTVADLEKQVAFYRDILGFTVLSRDGDVASLGVSDRTLLRLTHLPGARRVRGTTGLYHTAFLVPTRWELAHLVRRIVDTSTRIQGTSDHGTHLAIYLPDPEGNGIELAWDFPKDEWPMKGGTLKLRDMMRGPVDLGALIEELERDPSPWTGLSPQTQVGHVHVHGADLAQARSFYHDLVGFDITFDSPEFRGIFVSAGGYHHHIGVNLWQGEGAPPAPPDAVGLRHFTIELPNRAEWDKLVRRLHDADLATSETSEGTLVRDPSHIGVMLTHR